MTLPALKGSATLDLTAWSKSISTMQGDLARLSSRPNTVRITASLAGGSAAAIQAQLRAITVPTIPVRLDASSLAASFANIQAQFRGLNTSLAGVVTINTSGLTAVQGQINTQIANLTALIAQLRALGGNGPRPAPGPSGGGISSGNAALLAQLEALNNEYKRGQLSAAQYAAGLTGLQGQLRAAAASAQVGTADFRALDRGITGIVSNLRRVQGSEVTKLRTELAGARAAFDAAAGAATSFAQKQAAIAAYNTQLQATRAQLTALQTSGRLTAEQLGQVNRLLAQTARESATISGRINIAGLSGNITNALGTLSQFVPGLGQIQSLLGGVTSGTGALGIALGGLAVTLGATAVLFTKSFTAAAGFQQTLADIKALTQPTAAEFDKLSAAALNIGQPLGVGARDSAAAIRELNKAGLSAADAIGGGLSAALTLAGAAGVTAADGSKLAVGAMTAFGLTAKDLPGVADVFANFANSTFLDAQDLSQALAAVGPVAKSAGLSLQEFAGLSATLAQGGFKNMSDAGTSLKTVLLSLQAPSDTAQKALDSIGVRAYTGSGQLKPFNEILDSLRGRLGKLSEQGRLGVLKDIFGTDGIRAATILLGQSQAAIQGNIDVQGKAGEAARVATERNESFQGSQRKLAAATESLLIVLGTKFLPTATQVADALTGIFNGGEKAQSFFQSVVGYVVPATIALTAFRAQALLATVTAFNPASLAAFFGIVTAGFASATLAAKAFVLANPIGIIATAAGALTAYSNQIITETAAIRNATDQGDAASAEGVLKQVSALRKLGDEASKAKAQVLLAIQALSTAQQGTQTGVDFFGNRTYTVDPKAIEEAQSKLGALKTRLREVEAQQRNNTAATALATEQARQYARASGTQSDAVFLSTAQLKKQAETIKTVRDAVAGRVPVGLDATAFEADVERIRKEYLKLRIQLKADVKDPVKLKIELANLDTARNAEVQAARAKAAQDGARSATEAADAATKAEIAAMRDGRPKIEAVRAEELRAIRKSIADKVDAQRDFPALQLQIEVAGRRQVAALQRGYAEEDVKTARETALRIIQARQTAQASASTARVAGIDNQEAQLQLAYTRQQALAVGNFEKLGALERRNISDLDALRARKAAEQFRQSRAGLDIQYAEAISREGLSAQERLSIVADFQGRVRTLESGAQTEAMARLDQRVQAERAASERVLALRKAAQIEVATRPAEQAITSLAEVQRQQEVAKSTAQRLDLERQAQKIRQSLVADYDAALVKLRAQGQTETELKDLTQKRADAQQNVLKGVIEIGAQESALKQQVADTTQAAQELNNLLGAAGQSDIVRAQADLARSVGEVGTAYQKAAPYLDALRSSQGLSIDQLKPAQESISALVTSLGAEQQALDNLKGKWQEQQSAVAGLLGIIGDLRTASGNVSLLQQAAAESAAAYQRAQLTLNATSGDDPVAAQKAASEFKDAYQKRISAVEQLAAAQAKQYEDTITLVQRAQASEDRAAQARIELLKTQGAAQAEIDRAQTAKDANDKARGNQLQALQDQVMAIKDATTVQVRGVNEGLVPALGKLQEISAAATTATQATGTAVSSAEAEYKATLTRVGTISQTFIQQLQKTMTSGGYQAGQALASGLTRGYLESLIKLPTPDIGGGISAGARAGAAAGNTTVNLYLDGAKASQLPGTAQLAQQIRAYATDQVRKGNK